MGWKSLAGAACALGLAVSAAAQSGDISLPPVLDDEALAALPLDQRFSRLLGQGRYLEAIDLIEGAAPDEVGEGPLSYYRQMKPALDGFFYKDPAAPPLPSPDPAELAAYDGAVAEAAIPAIVERARGRRVVIVNEAHNSPRDRAFVLKLAEALKPLGFTHYAAETFTNVTPEIAAGEMGWLESAGYARRNTGSYTAEPMFGYLVRRVLALGYRPVAYEIAMSPRVIEASMEERIVLREQAQAENLAAALAAAGPDAKFLVHVGYAHAAERPLPPGETEWMAARLARLTGIDPLTVEQTDISEIANPRARALHAALAARVGSVPAIFMKDGAPLATGRLGTATDLQVVHPLVTTIARRPAWLRDTGRRAVPVPAELLPREGRRLVQAFVAGEAEDAVPLDQALVAAGQEPPVLYVPDGVEIRWAVQE